MGSFDPEYYRELTELFLGVTQKSPQEQAEMFKLRYVLSVEEDVLAISDQAAMFADGLPHGDNGYNYNDPKLTRFLEECKVSFESFRTRNMEFNVLNPGNQKLTFIEFLLYYYRNKIMQEYCERWGMDAKSLVNINPQFLAQVILSELLKQPPIGIDYELDNLTREERETLVRHKTRVTTLRQTVSNAAAKPVKSVKEKQAIHELAQLEQTNIEEQLTFIRTQINMRARKVLQIQKEALHALTSTGYFDFDAIKPKTPKNKIGDGNLMQVRNGNGKQKRFIKTLNAADDDDIDELFEENEQEQNSPTTTGNKLPPGWEEYLDEKSGNYYYHNVSTGETQWDKPTV